jgi:hypothetical protein
MAFMDAQDPTSQPPTADDFAACDLEGPIAEIDHVGMAAISTAYAFASLSVPSPCKEVYGLLSDVTGIHLDPADRGEKWKRSTPFAGRRPIMPADIRGELADVLEAILPRIRHAALRARVADVVWSGDKRKAVAGRTAIESYCEVMERLADGSLKAVVPVEGSGLIDAQKPAHRALQIASAVKGKRSPIPVRVVSALESAYQQGRDEAQPVIFSRLAQLRFDYGLVGAAEAAADLEAVVAARPDIYPDAIRMALDFAGSLYGHIGDHEGERRCRMGAVRQMLRMRDQCGQASAKATWVMEALQRLHSIRSNEAAALEEELEFELRQLQRSSLREMATFTADVGIPGEREYILNLFEAMDFCTCLKSFAMLESAPKIDDLKKEALQRAENDPLIASMAAKHVDDMGRTILDIAGAASGEPPEDWFVHIIAQAESHRRATLVANRIEPVRLHILGRVDIEERHFAAIVWNSPFVPQLQAPLYALGFARFFQGDFPSAAYILFPQLEASLRHVLRARGVDPTKRRENSTEEDRSIDAIIANHRPELLAIFGEPLLEELNRIFNVQPGPTLRHDVAHGQMSAGQCYSADVVYGCWLLYRVCCLFVLPAWNERISPAIAVEEPGS